MKKDYYNTKESVDEYIHLAKDVNGLQLIEKLKKHLTPKSIILELGSGPGTDWENLNKNYKVIGSDNSSEFLNRLQKNRPEGEFILLDACTLATDQLFDCIYSNKVLHHLHDPELQQSVERQATTLSNDGVICHSFWHGEGEETYKGLYVNYHTESGLRQVFERYFDILLLERYQEFEEDDSILLIAKKI